MRIEPSAAIPIFQQIVDGIRGAIAAGVYRPGDLIPSVRAQAVASLVNPNTVARAYEQLEREGLVVSKKGTGMVVSANARLIAQEGAMKSVKATIAQAISLARAAGISRATVDKAYREAAAETLSEPTRSQS